MENLELETPYIKYKITVLVTISDIPKYDEEEFCLWLQNKAIELGTGKHNEYFYSEIDDQDIEVLFKVDKI